jgi:hypothetical protein
LVYLPTWSTVRGIGNSLPAKASVILPFVGYLILFNKHVVEAIALHCIELPCREQVLFPKLYYLYFGLTFFGVASFLYQLRCDSRIKRFANVEDYILSVKEITSDNELYKYQLATEELVGESAATSDFLIGQLADPQQAPQLKLNILTSHYRALDGSKPISRFFVLLAYGFGFLFMAIPAMATFIQVTKSFVESWS